MYPILASFCPELELKPPSADQLWLQLTSSPAFDKRDIELWAEYKTKRITITYIILSSDRMAFYLPGSVIIFLKCNFSSVRNFEDRLDDPSFSWVSSCPQLLSQAKAPRAAGALGLLQIYYPVAVRIITPLGSITILEESNGDGMERSIIYRKG